MAKCDRLKSLSCSIAPSSDPFMLLLDRSKTPGSCDSVNFWRYGTREPIIEEKEGVEVGGEVGEQSNLRRNLLAHRLKSLSCSIAPSSDGIEDPFMLLLDRSRLLGAVILCRASRLRMHQSTTSLGPLVRLEGISINQLPPGGNGSSTTTIPTASTTSTDNNEFGHGPAAASASLDIKTSITNVIREAVPFIDGVAPESGASPKSWKKTKRGSGKRYASSEALVYSFKRVVKGKELDKIEGMGQFRGNGFRVYGKGRKDETWFCRRSCHRNAAETGTASWEEFVHSFKEHHHETEDAFTATVIGAREAVTWDTTGIEVVGADGVGSSSRWIDLSMKVVEMKHKIEPKPLKNRTFPVLQIAAMVEDVQEFLVVSIPINDFQKSPHAEYAMDKSLVVGAYVAVERIRVLPSSGAIEWIMATASNAKGVLPQWMQNLAVPGVILEDVDFFMSWIPTTRKA